MIRSRRIHRRAVLVAVLVAASMLFTGLTAAFAVPVETFDTNPVLAPTKTAGAWYTDRYAPAAFESAVFDGDNRLRLGISAADLQADPFRNTQGRKYDLTDATFVSADLYVGPDWETNSRRAGLWATAVNAGDVVSFYPIIDFINTTGFRVWNGASWVNIGYPAGFAYGEWYNLRAELNGTSLDYYIDGALVQSVDVSATASVKFDNMIIQGFNFGDTYDIYWDNASPLGQEPVVSTPASSTWSLMLVAVAGLGLVGFLRRERHVATL